MGNILASLHQEHKDRQLRISRAALKDVTEPITITSSASLEKPPAPQVIERKITGSTFDIILNEICRYYNVRELDILSQRKLNNIAERRHMLAYMLYRMTGMTSPQIAPKMNRDPSTVGYAIKKIQANLEKYQSDIDALENSIRELLALKKPIVAI